MKLAAKSIGTEKFGRYNSYAMNYRELSELFLQLFEWYRNTYSIIYESALLPSSELLLALKAHLANIRGQLTPLIVMCVLNLPKDTVTKILPQYLEDSVSAVQKARCMFERGGKRCKLTVMLDEDFGIRTSEVYCRHHKSKGE